MTSNASGTFQVKMTPQPLHEGFQDSLFGRMSMNKQFQGDLDATSRGEFFSVGTEVKGSAGYVAIERVSGTLHGRRGAFALHHSGRMTRGVPELNVSVVPDSGTGELLGLAGKMNIHIEGGKHSYEFEYTLDESQ